MPYTPSGGYYETDTRGRAVKAASQTHPGVERGAAMRRVRRKRGILVPPNATPLQRKMLVQRALSGTDHLLRHKRQVQPGKYAVLICFDTPNEAKTLHRHIAEFVHSMQRYGTNNARLGVEINHTLVKARSVALHDCQKHPLNVKY